MCSCVGARPSLLTAVLYVHSCCQALLVVDIQYSQLQLPVLLRIRLRELHVCNDALQMNTHTSTMSAVE